MLHAKSLPGNPYDGHTLRDVIEDTQKLTGCEIERAYVDKGYRGHEAQNPGRVFNRDRNAASSAPSNANCDVDPQSSP